MYFALVWGGWTDNVCCSVHLSFTMIVSLILYDVYVTLPLLSDVLICTDVSCILPWYREVGLILFLLSPPFLYHDCVIYIVGL